MEIPRTGDGDEIGDHGGIGLHAIDPFVFLLVESADADRDVRDARLDERLKARALQQNAVGDERNLPDLRLRSRIADFFLEALVDQGIADDRRELDHPATERGVVVDHLFEQRERHDTLAALLILVAAKHAVGIADIGHLDGQLLRPNGARGEPWELPPVLPLPQPVENPGHRCAFQQPAQPPLGKCSGGGCD